MFIVGDCFDIVCYDRQHPIEVKIRYVTEGGSLYVICPLVSLKDKKLKKANSFATEL